MSYKKKSNKKATSAEQSGLVNEIQAVQSGSTRTGLLQYLKTHLWLVGIICFLALGVLGAGLKYLDENAKTEFAARQNKGYLNNPQNESFLNKVNPFLPNPTPTPTPQHTKDYIYAGGGRLLAVADKNAVTASPADLAIWRPGTGYWWVMNPNGSVQASTGWGQAGDKPVPGDYDGDGKTDFAIYRKATGQSSQWWILKSSDGNYYQGSFGVFEDTPAPADYDGDGKTDVAVYHPDSGTNLGTWYIQRSSDGGTTILQFGLASDSPAAADYDADGKADIGVWRPSTTAFYSMNSGDSLLQTPTISQTGDKVVSADYDGDGRADYGVYNSTTAVWYIRHSANGQVIGYQWGSGGDIPVQNDYDGDGKVDIATWRNANGNWYIRQSSKLGQATELRQVAWGMAGDTPVPIFYRR